MKKNKKTFLVLLATSFAFTPLIGSAEVTLPQTVKEEPKLSDEVRVPPVSTPVVQTPGILKGKDVPYCIKFDPAKWELTKEINNPAAEFALKRTAEPVYSFVIPERTPVPLDSMPEIIVYNATSKGMKDVKVIKKEKRSIDGKDVLFIEWEGVIGDMNAKISYLGYVFSGTEGTVQLYTFTMSSFLDMYRNDMMELLNGFCFVKPETKT